MDEQTAIAIALVGAGGATVGAEEDELVRPGHAGGDRLGYVHIGERHRGFLGSGHLDFTGSPHAVADIGCRGPVTLETFSSAVQAPEQSHNLATHPLANA